MIYIHTFVQTPSRTRLINRQTQLGAFAKISDLFQIKFMDFSVLIRVRSVGGILDTPHPHSPTYPPFLRQHLVINCPRSNKTSRGSPSHLGHSTHYNGSRFRNRPPTSRGCFFPCFFRVCGRVHVVGVLRKR